MNRHLSEYGKDFTMYVVYAWWYSNISQKGLGVWTQQNTKGSVLQLLKVSIWQQDGFCSALKNAAVLQYSE